jgi:hypothetical protein
MASSARILDELEPSNRLLPSTTATIWGCWRDSSGTSLYRGTLLDEAEYIAIPLLKPFTSAGEGAPGVCYNLRSSIDVDTGPEYSEEPTGPM